MESRVNKFETNRPMKAVSEYVEEAIFDIIRELDREEGLALFRQLVGRITVDFESNSLEIAVGRIARQRVAERETE